MADRRWGYADREMEAVEVSLYGKGLRGWIRRGAGGFRFLF